MNRSARNTVFSVLMGISAAAVILQGLWAGIFLEHDGHRDAAGNWIDIHARGAEVALAFAVLGTAYALWKRRARKDLWIGGLVFTALIIAESYMGGQIRDAGQNTLTAIHVPLAMAIMGLAVWLPVRAARRQPSGSRPPPSPALQGTATERAPGLALYGEDEPDDDRYEQT